MDISFFRSRIPGPELLLEDVVTNSVGQLTSNTNLPSWVACSPRIGAGMPDILFAHYQPQIFALSDNGSFQSQLLAFLRTKSRASFDTLLCYLNYSEKVLSAYLEELVGAEIIKQHDDSYYLTPIWMNILPTIISIEVKVHDWRNAIAQASRNRLFSHKSYVALPKKTATRIMNNPIFNTRGIGLLSIDDDLLCEEITPVSSQPQIWEYYYKLATILVSNNKDNNKCLSLLL